MPNAISAFERNRTSEQNTNFPKERHRDTCHNATGRGVFQHYHRRLRPIGSDHRALAIRLISHFDLSTLADGTRTVMKLDPAIVARVQFAFTVSF
jgi:hypothetical protein